MLQRGVVLLCVACAVALAAPAPNASNASWASDYEACPASSAAAAPALSVVHDFHGSAAFTAHRVTVPQPAARLAVLAPATGCGNVTLATPQATAEASGEGCVVATNAGFFDPAEPSDHHCIGALVGDGVWRSPGHSRKVAAFGIRDVAAADGDAGRGTHSARQEIVVGYINASDMRASRWRQLVTGLVWLVRDGGNNVAAAAAAEDFAAQTNGSPERFVTIHAPRLALGHDEAGRAVLVALDGEESMWEGQALSDFADVLISMGLVNAVNLDGGGSVSMFVNASVVSVPSDECVRHSGAPRYRCPRKVASALCVRGAAAQLFTPTPSASRAASASQTVAAAPPPPPEFNDIRWRLPLSSALVLVAVGFAAPVSVLLYVCVFQPRHEKVAAADPVDSAP
jgi:hypothetical protein